MSRKAWQNSLTNFGTYNATSRQYSEQSQLAGAVQFNTQPDWMPNELSIRAVGAVIRAVYAVICAVSAVICAVSAVIGAVSADVELFMLLTVQLLVAAVSAVAGF